MYRLEDLNFDGDCNDPGESGLFWAPPAVGNAFYFGLAVDSAGVFYVTDHGNEQVWRAEDADGDARISSVEETLFFQTGGSTWWDVLLDAAGVVYLCEDQSPDRLVSLVDANGDLDALDPGESVEIYSDVVSATATRPRGAAFLR